MWPTPDIQLREDIREILRTSPGRRFNDDREVDRLLDLILDRIPERVVSAKGSPALTRAEFVERMRLTDSELRRLIGHRCDRLPVIVARWLRRQHAIADIPAVRAAVRTRETTAIRSTADGITPTDDENLFTTLNVSGPFIASNGVLGEVPLACSPATDPLNGAELRRDSLSAAINARHSLLKEATMRGPLPVLGGTVAPVLRERHNGQATGRTVAYGDDLAVVHDVERRNVPYVLQAFVGPDGSLQAPEHALLDVSPILVDHRGREIRPFGIRETRDDIAGALRDRRYEALEPFRSVVEALDGDDRLLHYRRGLILDDGVRRTSVGVALHLGGDDSLTVALTNLDCRDVTQAQALAATMHILGSAPAVSSTSDCRGRYHRFQRMLDLDLTAADAMERYVGLTSSAYSMVAVSRAHALGIN